MYLSCRLCALCNCNDFKSGSRMTSINGADVWTAIFKTPSYVLSLLLTGCGCRRT
jgi:hypothetical protein